MSLYLYGIIPEGRRIEFGGIGFGGGAVTALPHGRLAGLVCRSPLEDFKNLAKEKLVDILLSHQRTLEAVMRELFVLPFKFGTTISGEDELRRILDEHGPFFDERIGRMKGCAEYDIVATWDVRATLAEIAGGDPEILARKAEVEKGIGDRASIGMLLAARLKERALRHRAKIVEAIEPRADGVSDHDVLNDAMVLNSSFLVVKDGEARFFQAIEALDRSFEGKLEFKCVGPLPPYSFATVALRRFDPEGVLDAARLMGLDGPVEAAGLKRIYKEMSRRVHPDAGGGLEDEHFTRLSEAYLLLLDYCEAGPRPLSREAIGRYIKVAMAPGVEP